VAFCCAGVSAIITVGLASVYSSAGFLGIEERMKTIGFRVTFVFWLIAAAVFSLLPNRIAIMVFTQYLNGALLPLILVPLVLLARNRRIIGDYRLGKTATVLASMIIIITFSLFVMSLL
jgi:manganese transport protein